MQTHSYNLDEIVPQILNETNFQYCKPGKTHTLIILITARLDEMIRPYQQATAGNFNRFNSNFNSTEQFAISL